MVTQLPEPWTDVIKFTGANAVPASTTSVATGINLVLGAGYKLNITDISCNILAVGAGTSETELACFVDGDKVPQGDIDLEVIDARDDKTLFLTTPIRVLHQETFAVTVANLNPAGNIELHIVLTGEIVKISAMDV